MSSTKTLGRDVGIAQYLFGFSLATSQATATSHLPGQLLPKMSSQYSHLSTTFLPGLCQHSATQKLWSYIGISFAATEISKGSSVLTGFGVFLQALNISYSDNLPSTFIFTHSPSLQIPVDKSQPCISLNLSLAQTRIHIHTHSFHRCTHNRINLNTFPNPAFSLQQPSPNPGLCFFSCFLLGATSAKVQATPVVEKPREYMCSSPIGKEKPWVSKQLSKSSQELIL